MKDFPRLMIMQMFIELLIENLYNLWRLCTHTFTYNSILTTRRTYINITTENILSRIKDIQKQELDKRLNGQKKSERIKEENLNKTNNFDEKNAVEIDDEPINGEENLTD